MRLTVLDHLWANSLTIPGPALLSPIPTLLGKVTCAPIVTLSTTLEADSFKAVVAYASEELLPGANLADLLFEECDIDVPEGAIVYIETASMANLHDIREAPIANLLGQLVLKLATQSATGELIDASIRDIDIPHFSSGMPSFSRIREVVQ